MSQKRVKVPVLVLMATPLVIMGCGGNGDSDSRSDPLEYSNDYCSMEAACIPQCSGRSEWIPCNSDVRTQECEYDYPDWAEQYTNQGPACKDTLIAWLKCITKVSCPDVQVFLQGHPDGLQDGDPCASEYIGLECIDFEPLTEYGFE